MYLLIKSKKAVAPLIIILGLLVVGAVIYAYQSGQLNLSVGSLTGSGSYIERPVFKYVKCEAIGSLKYSDPTAIANAGQWLLPKPSVSSSYNVKFDAKYDSFFGQSRFVYSVCNSQVNQQSNCRIFNKASTPFSNQKADNLFNEDGIKNNEVVFATLQHRLTTLNSWSGVSGSAYQIGFVPYGLREYDILSGSPSDSPINGNDCSMPSVYTSGRAEIISDDLTKTSVVSPKSNENTFQPEEVRWYVSGYVTSAAPSFVLTYAGKDAWCRTVGTSGEVYAINTVTTDQGTYKVASPDWSDHLGTLTCCPGSTLGNTVCNSAGSAYIQIAGSECSKENSAFKSCGSPNPVPYSAKKTIQYSCVNGYCKSTITDRECASDYDCQDSNEVCNNWKCVAANVDLKGQIIKTIADNSADCSAAGGVWTSSSTTTKEGIFCVYGLGLCTDKVVVNDYCKYPTPWTTYLIWAIVLIIIGLILFYGRPYFMPVLGFVKGYWWAIVILLILALIFGGYLLG
jgi:hypothetical protein